MNFSKFSVQTKAQTNRNAISSHAAGLAQLADEIIRQRFGSVIVIEGEHRRRIQLAQALANQMGYRMGLVTSKYIGGYVEAGRVTIAARSFASHRRICPGVCGR
jgi:hypothetical protein